MTAEERARHLMEQARYLENMAVEMNGNSNRHDALQEGARALRDVVALRQEKSCRLNNCRNLAMVCWDCHKTTIERVKTEAQIG